MLKSYGNLNDALLHTTTYNGFGEECITAIEAINYLVNKKLYLRGSLIEKKLKPKFNELAKTYSNKIKDYRGFGTMHGFIFYNDLNKLKKIQKYFKFSVLKDKKFLDKLLASALLDELFKKYGILATLKFNQEVILCIETSLIVTTKDLEYCIRSFSSLLKQDFKKLVLKFAARLLIRKFS